MFKKIFLTLVLMSFTNLLLIALPPATFNLKINNFSGGKGKTPVFSNDQIFVVGYGISYQTGKQCFLKFSDNGEPLIVTTLAEVTSPDTKSTAYTKPLSFFKGKSISIPNIKSGRLYFSLSNSLSDVMQLDVKSDLSINAPSFSDPTDPNFYRIYDKIEFTLDDTNQLYINPTAVDFFSIPISISLPPNNEVSGIDTSRAIALNGLKNVLSSANADPIWSKLFVSYKNSDTSTTLIRVASPKIKLQEYFNQDYLSNYITSLWKYYAQKGNTLSVDCSEVYNFTKAWTDPTTKKPYKKGDGVPQGVVIYENGSVQGEQLVFQLKPPPTQDITPTPSSTISVKKPSSFDFFSGDGGNWVIPKNSPEGIVMRELGSAFTVGLIPPEPTTVNGVKNVVTLNKDYFEAIKKLKPADPALNLGGFFAPGNPKLPEAPKSGTGFPWYNLYSKAIHSLGYPCYAYAFSDALGMDGTLQAPCTSAAATATVNINDMTGTVLPNTNNDTRTYTITFNMPPRTVEVKLNKDIQYNNSVVTVKAPIKIYLNNYPVSVNLNTKTTSPANIGVSIKNLNRDSKKGSFDLNFGPNNPPLDPIPANPKWIFDKYHENLNNMLPNDYNGIYTFNFDGASKCTLTWSKDDTKSLPVTPSGIIMSNVGTISPAISGKTCSWNVSGFSLDNDGNWTTNLTIQFKNGSQTSNPLKSMTIKSSVDPVESI